MQNRPLHGVFAALVCSIALLVSSVPVWAAQPGNYAEVSVGFTRPSKVEEGGLTADPASDITLGVAYGSSLSENTRTEAEFSYAKVAWDLGSGVDITADGFHLGTNFLYDVGAEASPAKFEIGIGLGWTFFDEACVEGSGVEVCVDADLDDWNVQGILGGSYALSETGAIVIRYRMQNIGGFSSEDRLHIFTVGYRHHF